MRHLWDLNAQSLLSTLCSLCLCSVLSDRIRWDNDDDDDGSVNDDAYIWLKYFIFVIHPLVRRPSVATVHFILTRSHRRDTCCTVRMTVVPHHCFLCLFGNGPRQKKFVRMWQKLQESKFSPKMENVCPFWKHFRMKTVVRNAYFCNTRWQSIAVTEPTTTAVTSTTRATKLRSISDMKCKLPNVKTKNWPNKRRTDGRTGEMKDRHIRQPDSQSTRSTWRYRSKPKQN